MSVLLDALLEMRDFFEAGGNVLWLILVATVAMWTLIVERLWYLTAVMPGRVRAELAAWQARADTTSWRAQRIREQAISQLSLDASRYLSMIKTLLAVLPLLGLLGTVTGMIRVFEVMAVLGTGNARAMASGVSAATIPTMAGLVAALSGVFFASALERRVQHHTAQAADGMGHPA